MKELNPQSVLAVLSAEFDDLAEDSNEYRLGEPRPTLENKFEHCIGSLNSWYEPEEDS